MTATAVFLRPKHWTDSTAFGVAAIDAAMMGFLVWFWEQRENPSVLLEPLTLENEGERNEKRERGTYIWDCALGFLGSGVEFTKMAFGL